MNSLKAATCALALFIGGASVAYAKDCADDPKTTGLSRTLAIDTTGGKQIGRLQYPKTGLLKPKEVVLTFDDG
ncbi:MAG TPA: polysaccharide deacetylase family protein, partial [Hyphomicrobiales bacterium]